MWHSTKAMNVFGMQHMGQRVTLAPLCRASPPFRREAPCTEQHLWLFLGSPQGADWLVLSHSISGTVPGPRSLFPVSVVKTAPLCSCSPICQLPQRGCRLFGAPRVGCHCLFCLRGA